ncbi:MAG TPA: SDR family NAD(P)-dependent oxidoreductase [Caldilineaceae bacterium]|nr:SDR family NAD(P)-dependent oxidoreductase [Caldilineaceae bacterium]
MTQPTGPLQEKVAIVTGAGRGIGKAIALAYAQAGATVVCAARTASEIEQTVREIEQAGGRGLALPTDVTDLAAAERLCAVTAQTFGGFDLVVINAGVNRAREVVEASDPADWQATLAVNLFGAYNCARAAIPHLKRRGEGKIITVGSGMGRHGRAGSSAYSCSKAALWMLTRVLAQELWPFNISVNELIPGPVDTAMTVDPAARQGPAFASESEWIKRPEDVAPLALFLATQPTIGPTAQSFSLMRRDG